MPADARLDSAQDAMLVDGAADQIAVRVGFKEHTIQGDELPSERPTNRTIDNVLFRWAAEDRSPGKGHSVRRTVVLPELHGIDASGQPYDYQPMFNADGRVSVVNEREALLSTEAWQLEAEAAILNAPMDFEGIDSSTSGREAVQAAFPEELKAWLWARRRFFEKVVEYCESFGQVGGRRATIYLLDFRDGECDELAQRYVDTYTALVSALIGRVRAGAKPALVEPILFCDRGKEGRDHLSLAPTHPLAVAWIATIRRGLFQQGWPDLSEREAVRQLMTRATLTDAVPGFLGEMKSL